MSQRIASQPHHSASAHHVHRESARRPDPRQRNAGRPSGNAAYTFAHAGRQVRFGPVVFWIAVGSFVIMAGWSIITATYFAFHDDVLKGLMARERAQQYAYEDRIADLRAEIDRTTSRQLLDQDQFEQKLDALVRRQASLEFASERAQRRRRPDDHRLDQTGWPWRCSATRFDGRFDVRAASAR